MKFWVRVEFQTRRPSYQLVYYPFWFDFFEISRDFAALGANIRRACTLWGKKLHPCSFCNNLIKLRSTYSTMPFFASNYLNVLYCIGLDWNWALFYVPANTVYDDDEYRFRLYGRQFLQVKRPNQQYQSTEGTNSTQTNQTNNKQTWTQNTASPL